MAQYGFFCLKANNKFRGGQAEKIFAEATLTKNYAKTSAALP
jgi:hypothetical protein